MLRQIILNFIDNILNNFFKSTNHEIQITDHLSLVDHIKNSEGMRHAGILNGSLKDKYSNLSNEEPLFLSENFSMDILILEEVLKTDEFYFRNKYAKLLKKPEDKISDEIHIKYRHLFYDTCFNQSALKEIELRKQLRSYISSENWISLKDFPYGVSYLLLSALNLFKNSQSTEDRIYLDQCSDRILRKLEIGKSKLIDFKNNSARNINLSEQLKVIYFCLRISEENNDLRFLNASMKALDRVYSLVKNININRNKDHIDKEILFLYVLNIERQEKLFTQLV